MRIAVLIPDRNDRPLFLNNCLRMIKSQTLQPEIIHIVNEHPKSNEKDITYRYRVGYEFLRGKNLDFIALIENDDWYDPKYLETMAKYWIENDKPKMLGMDHTIYYHIKNFEYFTMHHKTRASAMGTIIVPDLNFEWCVDNYAYTDIYLWKTIGGKIIKPQRLICLGIKHGIGKLGGAAHICSFERYKNTDKDLAFLKSVLDSESFIFYSNYFK